MTIGISHSLGLAISSSIVTPEEEEVSLPSYISPLRHVSRETYCNVFT